MRWPNSKPADQPSSPKTKTAYSSSLCVTPLRKKKIVEREIMTASTSTGSSRTDQFTSQYKYSYQIIQTENRVGNTFIETFSPISTPYECIRHFTTPLSPLSLKVNTPISGAVSVSSQSSSVSKITELTRSPVSGSRQAYSSGLFGALKIGKRGSFICEPGRSKSAGSPGGEKKQKSQSEKTEDVQLSIDPNMWTSCETPLSPRFSDETSLADFSMRKVIGTGTHGKVILARYRTTFEYYALKTVQKTKDSKMHQKCLATESSILQEVNHPFIIKFFTSFEDEVTKFFVLEFCRGGDLFTHISEHQGFPVDKARIYAAQVLLAFEHLHSKMIIYRDLKPENVLIQQDGTLRLTDFGLSKYHFSSKPEQHSLCGTWEYLAPEVLTNNPYGPSVDWYSLGVLLFEMLIGLPPFYSSDKTKFFNQVLHEPLAIPKQAQPCKDVLEELLCRDPQARLGASQGVIEIKCHDFFQNLDFEELLDGKLKMPFTPIIEYREDLRYFDRDFLEMPVEVNS